jgi:hypothetical protein
MKQTITCERLKPTTVDGDIIKVSIYFSSFDKEEIDKLYDYLKDNIGTVLVSEVLMEDVAECQTGDAK